MSPKGDSGGRVVIWPCHIDAGRPRSQGRLVPWKMAVRAPKLDEMERAAKALGLSPEAERDAAHPSAWWEKGGRLWVADAKPKSELCREIALKVREMRGEAPDG